MLLSFPSALTSLCALAFKECTMTSPYWGSLCSPFNPFPSLHTPSLHTPHLNIVPSPHSHLHTPPPPHPHLHTLPPPHPHFHTFPPPHSITSTLLNLHLPHLHTPTSTLLHLPPSHSITSTLPHIHNLPPPHTSTLVTSTFPHLHIELPCSDHKQAAWHDAMLSLSRAIIAKPNTSPQKTPLWRN